MRAVGVNRPYPLCVFPVGFAACGTFSSRHSMLRLFLLLCGACGIALGADVAPAMNFGQIKAVCVIGDVTATNQDDKSVTPLHNDDLLFQNYSVKTATDSSVVLVFSNGATVRLGADTEMSIGEFLQAPFPGEELAVGKLEQEPGPSSTKLRLVHGEIIGRVLRLHDRSSYTVYTPIGAAGIRGTTFRHVYRPVPNGTALFASATDEGEVAFTTNDGQVTPITAGIELSGHTRPPRRGGFAQFGTHDIARRTKVAIDHHVGVMRVVKARVIFRRADTLGSRSAKPLLRRDPLARRETLDDFKQIEREVQDRAKADAEKQARLARAQKEKAAKPAPKAPAKQN